MVTVLVRVEVLVARCEAMLAEWQDSWPLAEGRSIPTRKCTGRIPRMGHQ